MFGCICQCSITKKTCCKTGWTSANNAQICAIMSHRNFSQRTHPIQPIGPQTHVLEHFLVLGAFGNVSLLHEIRCTIGWIGASNGQVCAMKSHQKFFAMNAPDTSHWTVNTWFGAFHSVWVHFGLFSYCTKVDAKRAEMVELMHKFVPWRRVRIFQNKHTRSTQLIPKLIFWCVS